MIEGHGRHKLRGIPIDLDDAILKREFYRGRAFTFFASDGKTIALLGD